MAGTGKAHLRDGGQVLLVEDLVVEFTTDRGHVRAVSGVSLDVMPGETVGIVGESGCGKSSMGRAITMLPKPNAGSVVFEGIELTKLSGSAMRRVRTRLQMIYQDPISSLNPRRTMRQIVEEPLEIWRTEKASRKAKVDGALESMGFDPVRMVDRKPRALSGGQCQRVCIARALVLEPKLIVCDEPVSSLDVSVQAQILNLLKDMRAEYGLAMLFISHDLAVVNNVSDRVVVMYLGKLCEVGPPDKLYSQPRHHYTATLLDAIPERHIAGQAVGVTVHRDVPSPLNPPSGCRFRTRCASAQELCAQQEPNLVAAAPGHFVACHFPMDYPVPGKPGGKF